MATRRARNRPLPPPVDADVDEEVDAQGVDSGDEEEHRPRTTRRLSPAARKTAELHAALQANMRGEPRFAYPPDMPETQKPYWLLIVNAKPIDYFNDGDIVLLKMYCRAASEVDQLDREIEAEGHVVMGARGPVMNPRITARAIAETRLLSLSTKLRSQPSSRYDSENDRKQTQKANSATRTAQALDEGSRPTKKGGRVKADDEVDLLARPSAPSRAH